jgi:hypothetical protein
MGARLRCPPMCLRQTHLNVLIYEGIVADVFNYDYAPRPTLVGSKRIWMSVSQEGKDDVDDLRQKGLVNGLKLVTDDLQPVTAFQVCSCSSILVSPVRSQVMRFDFVLLRPDMLS